MPEDSSPPTPNSVVSLREVTAETVRAVCSLKVRPHQEQFVANNAFSIAQAHFSPLAWFRAVYADETPVGFVMLEDNPENAEYFLWRFMIDARYQGLGFGWRALLELIEYVRARPAATEFSRAACPAKARRANSTCGWALSRPDKCTREKR